ncbi:MAG: AAA family ATPase [Clostridia bacterium]|nr:AAA family ATPase [Clostridia bacterium]MDD4145790.1 AAA family ATPase [Clostridia bacterium]MDD4665673.1 AAA family ATPase [Clostridia bacterium]
MNGYKLKPEQLRKRCDCSIFPFESTAEISPLEGIMGQERGVRALEFGLKVNKHGYNIFIAGVTGTGRSSYACSLVNNIASTGETPLDWCYLYNFEHPDQPKAVSFPPGQAVEFQKDIQELLSKITMEIPLALESDEYQKAKTILLQKLQVKQNEVQTYINSTSKELGFALKSADKGLVTIPLNNEGKPMDEEEFQTLYNEKKEIIDENSQKLNLLLLGAFKKLREFERGIEKEVEKLEKKIILNNIEHFFHDLTLKYSAYSAAIEHLENIKKSLLKNAKEFKDKEQPSGSEVFFLQENRAKNILQKYQVNVLIDNSKTQGAPVIVEVNPVYYNLLGRVEYESHLGVLKTDFTKIKAGSLHQANGGYLILRCRDVLTSPLCWDALKRALKTGEIQIESIGHQLGAIATSSLRPEPIPLQIKVIIIGSHFDYQVLYYYDEDFRKLFKIMVDFDVEMERSEEHMYKLARFISDHCEKEGLRHFSRDAVGQIVEYSSRLADSQKKLSTRFNELVEIIYEADTWAGLEGSPLVTAEHVQKSIREKVYRSNKYEQKLLEMMNEEQLLIDIDKKVVGQVNGVAVLDTGNYTFGKPNKITVNTFLGRKGIINIEREVKMSGALHDKGVLILSGYLGEKFGQKCPVSFSASICFEQLYSGVDGDSASSAELYALFSSLADLPIEQGIAVTGSVNQKGFIQPIGGVNQKIEGFYQVCKAKGFTGKQGVIIPYQNVVNLMLDEEVVTAVKEGSFHLYAVKTLEEGIEILTGVPAGAVDEQGHYPADTVFGRIQKKLGEYYAMVKEEQNNCKTS